MEQAQFWIGLGFASFVAIILAVKVFSELKPSQYIPLRVLCAFCAAISGVLISGSLAVSIQGVEGPVKYAIQGTAGFAFFLVFWFFFPKPLPDAPPLPPDSINLSLIDGIEFRDAVDSIVRTEEGATQELVGFEPNELDAPLRAWKLTAPNAETALKKLQTITQVEAAIRPYQVTYVESTYKLKVGEE